ncbi:UNVERIFIED_CONTAM: hypothetical protein NO986_13275, partial [Comamonas sp. A-3]
FFKEPSAKPEKPILNLVACCDQRSLAVYHNFRGTAQELLKFCEAVVCCDESNYSIGKTLANPLLTQKIHLPAWSLPGLRP